MSPFDLSGVQHPAQTAQSAGLHRRLGRSHIDQSEAIGGGAAPHRCSQKLTSSVQVLARFQRPNYRNKMQQDQSRPRSRRMSDKVLQVIVIARRSRTLLRVEVRLGRVSATIGHNCSQLATTPRRHPLTIPLSKCRVLLASMLLARLRRIDDSSPSVAPRLAGLPVA